MSVSQHKMDAARFSIRFNPADPYHQKAMTILSHAGRRKSTLIADAICAYWSSTDETGLRPAAPMFPLSFAPQIPTAGDMPTPEQEISSDWISVSISDAIGEGGDA